MRAHFDRMTRAYLLSVLDDELIEEHRTGDAVAIPASRCHGFWPGASVARLASNMPSRRKLMALSASSAFQAGAVNPRAISVTERYATLQEARHGVFLRHINDLTEK